MSGGKRLGVLRTAEMAAIFMIGDGVLGLVMPQNHVALWRSDAGILDRTVRSFAERPAARRLYGLLQIAAGFAIGATAANIALRLNPRSTISVLGRGPRTRPISSCNYLSGCAFSPAPAIMSRHRQTIRDGDCRCSSGPDTN